MISVPSRLVLKEPVEIIRFRQVLREEPAVGLVADAFQQSGNGHLDIADEPEINSCSATKVFGILSI